MKQRDLQSALTKLGGALPTAIPVAGPIWGSFAGSIAHDRLMAAIVAAGLTPEEKKALLASPATIVEAIKGITDEGLSQTLAALAASEERLEEIVRLVGEAPDGSPVHSGPRRKLTAVIPTGGGGRGMWPLTSVQPKCLVPINCRPLLAHILDGLDHEVFSRAIVTSDDWHPMVQSYGQAFYTGEVRVDYVQVRAHPAQQLVQLRDAGLLSDPFLLHYCDIRLHNLPWVWVLASYDHSRRAAGADHIGMVLASYQLKLGVGIVHPGDDDFVEDFLEHPTRLPMGDLIGTGVALLSSRFLDYIQPKDESVFGDVVPRAIRAGGAKLAYMRITSWDHLQHMHDLYDCQLGYFPHMEGKPPVIPESIDLEDLRASGGE